MRTFYKYTVLWLDEYNETKPWKDTESSGLVTGESFKDAIAIVERLYDYIQTITLDCVNDDEALDFEDLLLYLNPQADRNSAVGPQIIAALKEAIEANE